jgi:acetolactate synthase-1/2/3 large subunit
MTDFARLSDDIVAHGVKHVFGIPGSGETLSLIDALETRGVQFHLTHSEGAGALMAATVGRLSHAAGVSLSIKGPGLTNAIPGIAAAWFEGFPLVHFTEGFPPNAPLSMAHKRIDQAALVQPITKDMRYLTQGGPGFSEIAAFARAEEPGPSVVTLAGKVETDAPAFAEAPAFKSDLQAALKLASSAERPIVIAGTLAHRNQLRDTLASLPFPVFSTAASKGIIDETAENAAGVFTGVGLNLTPESGLLGQADLIVGIGLTAREALATKPFPVPYVAVEAVETPGTAAFAPAARVHIADVAEILTALRPRSWGLENLARIVAALQANMQKGFLPGCVFHAIERRFDRRARVVLDTGYFCTIGEHALRPREANLCLMSGQGRYMGTGLPMALGAALHDPTTPTIVILGDGGIAMHLAEAKLAAQNRLPLLIVLMTDNTFSSIRTRALKHNLTQKPLTMDGKGWTASFDALGLPSHRAETLAATEAALAAWRPENGPAFLEIPFAPEPYEAMVAGIR